MVPPFTQNMQVILTIDCVRKTYLSFTAKQNVPQDKYLFTNKCKCTHKKISEGLNWTCGPFRLFLPVAKTPVSGKLYFVNDIFEQCQPLT